MTKEDFENYIHKADIHIFEFMSKALMIRTGKTVSSDELARTWRDSKADFLSTKDPFQKAKLMYNLRKFETVYCSLYKYCLNYFKIDVQEYKYNFTNQFML